MDIFTVIPNNYSSPFMSPLIDYPRVDYQYDVYTPVLPVIKQPYRHVLTSASDQYYYYTQFDTGVDSNPILQNKANKELRYLFLDKWLYDDYRELLRMLKVVDGSVKVLSSAEAKNNDISNDTMDENEKKSDFIGFNILTLAKNKKLLDSFVFKTGIRWMDLGDNHRYVKREQAKYVKKKLEQMKF